MTAGIRVWINGVHLRGATDLIIEQRFLQPARVTVQINKQSDIYAPTLGNFGDELYIEYDFSMFENYSMDKAEVFYGAVEGRRDGRDFMEISGISAWGLLGYDYTSKVLAFPVDMRVSSAVRSLINTSSYSQNATGQRVYIASVTTNGLGSATIDEAMTFDGTETILDSVMELLTNINTDDNNVTIWDTGTKGGGATLYAYSDTYAPCNNIIYTSEIIDYHINQDSSNRFSDVIAVDDDGAIGKYPQTPRPPYCTKKISVKGTYGELFLQTVARHYYNRYHISNQEIQDNTPTGLSLIVYPMHTLIYRPGDKFRVYLDADTYYDMILYSSSLQISADNIEVRLELGRPEPNIKQLVRGLL